MWNPFFSYEKSRLKLLKQAPEGTLKRYLSVPCPSLSEAIENTSVLAVDFETTGLDPNHSEILSIGHITMENNEILLDTAFHKLIKTTGDLNEENVVIHQITDQMKDEAGTLESAIENLLEALAGKVMLVHFSKIEKGFLEAACRHLYGMAPVIPIIDTLMLAKRRLDLRDVSYSPSELRLFTLRERYQLPRYSAHNALSDALATAELLLAEVAHTNPKKSPPLKQLLS